jgi:hypothetical protein
MESQSLLLSEPVYGQTGPWYESAEISQSACKAEAVPVKPAVKCTFSNPDSLKSRFKRLFCFNQDECEGVPVVCWGRLYRENQISKCK